MQRTKLSLVLFIVSALFLLSSSQSFARSLAPARPDIIPPRSSVVPMPSARAENRLEGAKLRACEAREQAIRTRTSSLIRLNTNMLEKFEGIFNRVDEFYHGKDYQVDNYDALVAQVREKKQVAETTMATVQNTIAGFDCSSDDPKGNLNQFRLGMQNQIRAMNEYKTAIRNFIVAVKSGANSDN